MIRYTLHRLFYKAVRIIIMPYLRRRFGFRFIKSKTPDCPSLILSNHNTDWDPFFLSQSFPDHMYFVASEHIFRWGLASRMIKYLAAPIPRAKATNEIRTVKQVLRMLKSGYNVCIFAEGNRSFNGETSDISASTGKLVKQSGAALITYRLRGGYFTQPRWGRTIRRGNISGGPVSTYIPDILSGMSEDEINRILARDLYVNAYDDQIEKPVLYKGNRLAEDLETVLYLCPACGGMSTITSEGDTVSCPCGLTLRYKSDGFFEDPEHRIAPFDTILKWDRWQISKLTENLSCYKEMDSEIPITNDTEQMLFLIHKYENSECMGSGELLIYNDRLKFDAGSANFFEFPLDSIADMAVHGQMDLVFATTDGRYYEIRSQKPRSATKYLQLFRLLTDRKVSISGSL